MTDAPEKADTFAFASTESSDSAALVRFPIKCRSCRGKGVVVRWACVSCAFLHGLEVLTDPEATPPPLYTEAQLVRLPDGSSFPRCEHPVLLLPSCLNAERGEYDCPRCGGTGKTVIWLPPDIAEARRQRERKRNRDTSKRLMSAAGQKIPCEAITRQGKPCIAPCEPGKAKCWNHGGGSTGSHKSASVSALLEAARAKHSKHQRASPQPPTP